MLKKLPKLLKDTQSTGIESPKKVSEYQTCGKPGRKSEKQITDFSTEQNKQNIK